MDFQQANDLRKRTVEIRNMNPEDRKEWQNTADEVIEETWEIQDKLRTEASIDRMIDEVIECSGCGRVMSHREAWEQGECSDCQEKRNPFANYDPQDDY